MNVNLRPQRNACPPSVRSPKCHPNKLAFFCCKVTFCSGFSGPITTSALCLGFNTTQSRTQNKPVEHFRDLCKPCWPEAVNLSFIVFNQIHQLFSSTSVTAAKESMMTECRWFVPYNNSLAAHWLNPLRASIHVAWRIVDVIHLWVCTLYIQGCHSRRTCEDDTWESGHVFLMCLETCVCLCWTRETLPCCQTWICYGAWQTVKHDK